MAEQIYYSVFTKKGLELLTEAIRNGTKLGITSMAFGDGGGSLPVPNENFTSMVREVHRTQLNSLAPDPNNANWLRAEAIIASAIGGFNIRELGLYAGDTLVAYSNYPATYKPNPSDGTARIMTFRMVLQIDNTANFDLVIDPDVVLATIQFVTDKFKKTITSVDNFDDMRNLKIENDLEFIYVKDVDSTYKYDPTETSPLKISNFVLQFEKSISLKQLDIQDGTDVSDILNYCYENNIFVEVPENLNVISSVFEQDMTFGHGSVHFKFDYATYDNTEHVTPKTLAPYTPKKKKSYGWYDQVEARSNWEQGSGYGLIVNSNSRPQVCGWKTKQQQKNYPSVDLVGFYTDMRAPKSVKLENCTFTANSVSSPTIASDLDIKVGDYIVTDFDVNIGMPWRSQVTAIDVINKKISITWWLHESGNGEGTPPDGLACYTPYANGLWGQNTNVFLMNDDRAITIIGYELGVYTEKTRSNFNRIDGFYSVNLTSSVARAQDAFKTGGNWDNGLGAYNCTNAVSTDGTTRYGLRHKNIVGDVDSSAILLDANDSDQGYCLKTVAGQTSIFSISATGVQSHLKLGYDIISFSRVINGLSPTLLVGNLATGDHTTTISMSYIKQGHIFEFKQYQEFNWNINTGSRVFTLNKNGQIDYLKIYYDGSGWIVLFAGKSLL
ncbi:phage tail protein [Acinetobacter baumannii]